jgi:hypothetical protein
MDGDDPSGGADLKKLPNNGIAAVSDAMVVRIPADAAGGGVEEARGVVELDGTELRLVDDLGAKWLACASTYGVSCW